MTAASAPVGENQMIVLTRTYDSTTPSAGGYFCQDHHVKRVPIKAPMSRLHEKISHYVLVKLPGSEKQNCFIIQYSACQEGNLKIRACQHSAAQTEKYHYILVIFF
jgi:type VI protein secretion system component Hcp